MGSPTKGTIKEISFIQLLEEVAQSKLTGMIRTEKGPIIKVVYISQGTIAFASSNEKSDRLTEVLKRAGKLTTEQIDDAQARLKPNVSLGKTLVELGYISPKDLLWGARAQVEGILHQLLFWNEGNYQILEGPLPKEIVSLGLPIAHVLYEGIQKTQDRDWVLEQIVSPQSVYEFTVDFHEKYSSLKLPADAVVSRINGSRPLEEIAQSAGLDTFEVCKTVAALQILGLVQRIQSVSLETAGGEQDELPIGDLSGGLAAEPSSDLSLGQVFQMPTVAELQAEQEEETIQSTMISPKPQAPPPVEEETPISSPVAEEVPDSRVEAEEEEEAETEAEDSEEPVSFLESSSVTEMPSPDSGPVLTFGTSASKRRSQYGPPRTINWRKMALLTGLLAALVLGGLKLYTSYDRSRHLGELAKLTTPIKQPVIHHPAQKPTEPVSKPVEGDQQTPVSSDSTDADGQAQKSPAQAKAPPLDAQKTPVQTKLPPAETQKPVVATQKPPVAAQKTPAQVEKTPVTPPTKPPEPAVQKAATPIQMLQGGKLVEAAAAWKKDLARSQSGYTIQLEIACQSSTIQEAIGLVDATKLLVIPIDYHGKSCYRILYGRYTTQSSAESARSGLPSIFLKQEAPARVVAVGKIIQ